LSTPNSPPGGLSLAEATLAYGDLARPEKLKVFRLWRKARASGDPTQPRDDDWLTERCSEEVAAQTRLIEKLQHGELGATGFDVDTLAPIKIHSDLWRVLVPDFDPSAAKLNGKDKIGGILVFTRGAPQSTNRRVKIMREALEDLYRKGEKFSTAKAAHSAVLRLIGETEETNRGLGYETFRTKVYRLKNSS